METLLIIGFVLVFIAVSLLRHLVLAVWNFGVACLIVVLWLVLQIMNFIRWALRLPDPAPRSTA